MLYPHLAVVLHTLSACGCNLELDLTKKLIGFHRAVKNIKLHGEVWRVILSQIEISEACD